MEQRGLLVLSCDPAERTLWRGVGFELTRLYKSVGITPPPQCQCHARAAKMDQLGPSGCRAQFAELVADMKTDSDKFGWSDRIGAGWKSIKSGLAFRMLATEHPTDPIAAMLEIAIERTEAADAEWEGRLAA